jgi:antitoxin VapB
MALSIRNPLAEKLAREVSTASGENMTQAIIHALEEKLERLRGRKTTTDTTREILKISQRCSALPDLDARTPEEILGYNQHGIPE